MVTERQGRLLLYAYNWLKREIVGETGKHKCIAYITLQMTCVVDKGAWPMLYYIRALHCSALVQAH